MLLRVVEEEEGVPHLQKHENNKIETDLQEVLQAIAENRSDAPQSLGSEKRSPAVLPIMLQMIFHPSILLNN